MSRQIQIRRGTAAQHQSFIGAIGEVTMDIDTKTLHVHDGVTPGGIPLARRDEIPENTGGGTTEIPNNYDFVIESASGLTGTGYTNGWYRKYKSGWTEQGASILLQVGADSTHALPIAMLDTNYQALVVPGNTSASNIPQGWVRQRNTGSIVARGATNGSNLASFLVIGIHAN